MLLRGEKVRLVPSDKSDVIMEKRRDKTGGGSESDTVRAEVVMATVGKK